MKNAALDAELLALTASPALAKEIGAYASVSVGLTSSETQYTENTPAELNQSLSSMEAGVYAGYRHQIMGPFGIGAEGGFDFLGKAADSFAVGAKSMRFEKKYSWYVAARPSYAFDDATLAFASVGLQRAKFDGRINIDGVVSNDDESFNGLRLGVGLERDLAANIAPRVEGTYVNYGEKNYSAGATWHEFDPGETNARLGFACTC